jgi:hypothetical protein
MGAREKISADCIRHIDNTTWYFNFTSVTPGLQNPLWSETISIYIRGNRSIFLFLE